MVSANPDDRHAISSIAAKTRWAREDPKPALVKVRAGRMRRYEARVDPERKLPEAERRRRAKCLWDADMRRMALKSAQARRKRKESEAAQQHEEADGE